MEIIEKIKTIPITRIMEWNPYGDGITIHFGKLHEVKTVHKRYGEISLTMGEYHIDIPDVFWRVKKNEKILFASGWFDDDNESILDNISETVYLKQIKKIDKNYVQIILTGNYRIDIFNLNSGNFENEECFFISDKNDEDVKESLF